MSIITKTIHTAWSLWLKDLESSEIFQRWGLYSAIASSLERRVYMIGDSPEDDDCIFPNLFILLVGPPASGKSRAMRKVWAVLRLVKEGQHPVFHKAPDSTSPAALLRKLCKSRKEFKITGQTDPYIYHSMVIQSEELGNLIKKNDTDISNMLIQFFDSFAFDKETITADSFDLDNICVNMIACTNPDWIKNSFSEALIGQGCMSRFVVVFADAPRFRRDTRGKVAEQSEAKMTIVKHLEKLSKLSGKVEFTEEAYEFRKYVIEHPTDNYLDKRPNTNHRLDYYYSRKRLAWFKLAMAMHFSESTEMIIDRPVMEEAYEFLNQTEVPMHKAFAGLHVNPTSEYYDLVLEHMIKRGGKCHQAEVYKQFATIGHRGVQECLDFLQKAGRIRTNGMFYNLVG